MATETDSPVPFSLTGGKEMQGMAPQGDMERKIQAYLDEVAKEEKEK